MEQIILIVHLLVALAIIGLIMLQQGKGADMGASFGAGASQTLVWRDGSGNVLTRATGWFGSLVFCHQLWARADRQPIIRPVTTWVLHIPGAAMAGSQASGSELP